MTVRPIVPIEKRGERERERDGRIPPTRCEGVQMIQEAVPSARSLPTWPEGEILRIPQYRILPEKVATP